MSPKSYGAKGDGKTDDTAAVQTAVNASSAGDTIDFGSTSATFLISNFLTILPSRTYSGNATIRLSASAPKDTPVFLAYAGASDNITINGLTLDGSSVGGILQAGVRGGNTAVQNLNIQNTTFANSVAGTLWESCLYIPVPVVAATISNNVFTNCGQGISINDTSNSAISYNTFNKTTAGNAIGVYIYNQDSGLTVSFNTGTQLTRMGIEIWGGGGSADLKNLVVRENNFSNWQAGNSDGFGISVVVGENAQILNNTLSNGPGAYGIECGSTGALVSGNIINGFPEGVVVQGVPNVTVSNNQFYGQSDAAVYLSNANNGNNPGTQILNNYMVNPVNAGVNSTQNNYGGSKFSGNIILRAGGLYAGDSNSGATFLGIKVDAGATSPFSVDHNTIIQTAAAPPANFQFWGIPLFQSASGSSFANNQIASRSTKPFGTAFILWSTGFLNGASVTNNQFMNLSRVSGGGTSSAIKISGNVASGVTTNDTYLVNAVRTLTTPIYPAVRINAGGSAYTDKAGNLWSRDADYLGGSTTSTTSAISGTNDAALYDTARVNTNGTQVYDLSLPNGNYAVTLKFAEIDPSVTKIGQRVASVSFDGSVAEKALDIVELAGGALKAVDRTYYVTVTSRVFEIQLTGVTGKPLVNAIQVTAP